MANGRGIALDTQTALETRQKASKSKSEEKRGEAGDIAGAVAEARALSFRLGVRVLPRHRTFAATYGAMTSACVQAKKTTGKERDALEEKWISAFEQLRAWGFDHPTWPEVWPKENA
jgi:hypothetical protein